MNDQDKKVLSTIVELLETALDKDKQERGGMDFPVTYTELIAQLTVNTLRNLVQ